MELFYYTQRGLIHSVNEDGLFVNGQAIFATAEPGQLCEPGSHGLFAVWDGLGGHVGGDIATKTALQVMSSVKLPEEPDCGFIHALMDEIVAAMRECADKSGLRGMGASFAAIWMGASHALIFNCGDCRVYQHFPFGLVKLSHDHSLVQDLFDQGVITAEEMRIHPDRHKLLSAVCATPNNPVITCRRLRAARHSRFLLCSDGLWGVLPHDELQAIMRNNPDAAATMLIEAYTENTGEDDCSFIIIQCP